MQDVDPGILSKYLAGQASAEEIAVAETWMRENDINREQLSKFLNPSDGVRVMMSLDPEKDWLDVRRKIRGGSVLYFPILKIAASVVLAVIVGFVAYRFLSPATPLSYKTITNTTGDIQTIALEDGSTLYLNIGSSITYPEEFANNRQVVLAGETFFEVKRDEAHPFTIEASQCRVQVLGTSFSVNVDSLEVEVIVKTGKVSFQSDEHNRVELVKNEKGIYHVGFPQIEKATTHDPNDFAWQTHVLTFENASFEKVIHDLEKYFRMEVAVAGDMTKVPGYTSRFDHPSLSEVMDEMKLILGTDYQIKNNTVKIQVPE
jgi:ferric-dicitrate binding protein FerR (iron transport regulator)